jgi:hypothetical protein
MTRPSPSSGHVRCGNRCPSDKRRRCSLALGHVGQHARVGRNGNVMQSWPFTSDGETDGK